MTTAATLGDAGAPGDDASYTGDVSASPVSLDYFRSKFREFQAALNAADSSYAAGFAVWSATGDEELALLLADYENSAGNVKAIAEAMNIGAAAVNAAGGRMPELSIPSTLGILPAFVLPAAAVAATAGAVYWIGRLQGFSAGVVEGIDKARAAAVGAGADAGTLAAIDAEKAKAKTAAEWFGLSSLGRFAGGLKLVGIGVLAFLAWRAYNDVMDR